MSSVVTIPPDTHRFKNLDPRYTRNLAPYSQFNNLSFDPPLVMFSAGEIPDSPAGGHATGSGHRKDSVANAEETGVFAWNMATYGLRDAVNYSAQQVPAGVDEFEICGLESVDSQLVSVDFPNTKTGKSEKVRVPMVKASPIKFECQYVQTLRLPGNPPFGTVDIVIGRVVGIHIDDDVIMVDGSGKVDLSKIQPIARCGYFDYAVVGGPGTVFEMKVPGNMAWLAKGLDGSGAKSNDQKQEEEQTEKQKKIEDGPGKFSLPNGVNGTAH